MQCPECGHKMTPEEMKKMMDSDKKGMPDHKAEMPEPKAEAKGESFMMVQKKATEKALKK